MGQCEGIRGALIHCNYNGFVGRNPFRSSVMHLIQSSEATQPWNILASRNSDYLGNLNVINSSDACAWLFTLAGHFGHVKSFDVQAARDLKNETKKKISRPSAMSMSERRKSRTVQLFRFAFLFMRVIKCLKDFGTQNQTLNRKFQ